MDRGDPGASKGVWSNHRIIKRLIYEKFFNLVNNDITLLENFIKLNCIRRVNLYSLVFYIIYEISQSNRMFGFSPF